VSECAGGTLQRFLYLMRVGQIGGNRFDFASEARLHPLSVARHGANSVACGQQLLDDWSALGAGCAKDRIEL
jgi:hypothetical protein